MTRSKSVPSAKTPEGAGESTTFTGESKPRNRARLKLFVI